MSKVLGWRYTFTSVPGTDHIKRDIPCQDASRVELEYLSSDEPVLILVAADGAGSARFAHIGASLACDSFLKAIITRLRGGTKVAEISYDTAQQLVGTVIDDRLKFEVAVFRKLGLRVDLREFASTLIAAVVSRSEAAFFHIGDGAIVLSQGHNCICVSWPKSGEYANSTYFLTDPDALKRLQFTKVQARVDELAIFTDGLQTLALNYASQEAHAPFFRPLFSSLRCEPEGESSTLNCSLRAWLNSPRVSDRTTDDKTLILATRRLLIPTQAVVS